jgi:putative Mn2+ efflux pump MntP
MPDIGIGPSVAIGLAVSMDSFLLALLVSRTRTGTLVMMLISPLSHAAFCVLGLLMHQSFVAPVEESLLAIAVLTILAAGVFLTVTYQPGDNAADNLSRESSMDARSGASLVVLSSTDALMAGLVYGCWGSSLGQAVIWTAGVNLVAVSCAALLGRILAPGRRAKSREGRQ